MQFWSKGLGRRSMGIDCGSEKVALEDDHIVLRGMVRPPLAWPYAISMDTEDWVAFFELTTHPAILSYLLRPRHWGTALRALAHLAAFCAAYLADCWRARLTRMTAARRAAPVAGAARPREPESCALRPGRVPGPRSPGRGPRTG